MTVNGITGLQSRGAGHRRGLAGRAAPAAARRPSWDAHAPAPASCAL